MKTITKTYNIYEFDELPQDIQQKVIEKEVRELQEIAINLDLHEYMCETAVALLKENFKDKAVFQGIYYSLSNRQGDGAVVEFDLVWYGKSLQIRHDNGQYYHSRSFDVLQTNFGNALTSKQYERLKEKITNINRRLEKLGYNFIEDDRTKQAVEELKNCMFYENGDIY